MQEKSMFANSHENDSENKDASDAELIFLIKSADENTLKFPFTHKDFWSLQCHRVAREPKKLIYHLQRIYYCYSEHMSEQLYAALVDLLIVLKGKKEGIGKRMYVGARSALNEGHQSVLDRFFRQSGYDEHDLPLNNYSVLGTGQLSKMPLVMADNYKNQAQVQYDPLQIARDYIEYSQLDEAREVLEKAVTENPDNRDYHEELLGLYKSTKDKENYFKMYERIKGQDSSLLTYWEQSLPLFTGS